MYYEEVANEFGRWLKKTGDEDKQKLDGHFCPKPICGGHLYYDRVFNAYQCCLCREFYVFPEKN